MASPLELAIAEIQGNNYTSLVIITAIGYDYILTFSREIEYIWNKPWTFVSTLFILARYFGLCSAISFTGELPFFLALKICMFLHAYVLTDNTKLSIQTFKQIHLQGEIIYLLGLWNSWIFICAADLAMILRVWALYNRSRRILCMLLTVYIIEVVSNFISYVFVSTQFYRDPPVSISQVFDYSFCTWGSIPPIWGEILDVVQIILGALMCLLVAILFVKESIQMYRVTKHLHLNRYMNLLVRQGILYFLAILGYALVKGLGNAAFLPLVGPPGAVVAILSQIPLFPLIPRFIVSLRELHVRDLQRRRGSEIDTAFGLGSGSVYRAAASAIIFAEGPNEVEREVEIQ